MIGMLAVPLFVAVIGALCILTANHYHGKDD